MPIKINKKTDHFFISINKVRPHSFIMLGVYDQHEVRHLLCRVGKFAVDNNRNELEKIGICCSMLFSAAKAQLCDEGIMRRKKNSQPISYQAYDITYTHYLEFIQLLEALQTDKNKFLCYKPTAERDGNEVIFDLTDEIRLSAKPVDKIKRNVEELSVGNTCRHLAIKLVETIQHAPVASLVSEHFFVELPYKTLLEYGRPSKKIPFYVLPAPPNAFFELDKNKKNIICKLYTRMEHMLLITPNARSTQNKFNKLKELYLQIIGPNKEMSLEELLQSIQSWKEENKSVLTVLRKTYFWDSFFSRQSATMNLIAEVEHDLQMNR